MNSNYITFDFSNMVDHFHNNQENDQLNALFHNEETEQNKRVTETFIKSLDENKHVVTMEDNLSCCLCMEDFQRGETVYKLPCNNTPHYFHIDKDSNSCECNGIKEWFLANNTCPICRTEFPYDEIKNIQPPEIIEYPIEDVVNYYNPRHRLTGHLRDLVDELERNILNPIPLPEYIQPNPSDNLITNNLISNFINRAFEEEEERQIQEAIELSLRD